MSLYDGLDLDEKADPIRSGEDLSGWGTSLKLLETQKQLQAKKCVLQNVKRKPQGTILAPVIDLTGRKNDVPSELRFNQQTGKLEPVLGAGSFFGADAPISFTGVTDEYDPLRPNDYESYSKKRREEKRRERERDEDSSKDRRSRHSDEDGRRRHDDDDDEDYDRRQDRDRDDDDYERRRRRRDDDDDSQDRRGVSKVAIAPPPSLMDLDIPPPEGFLQKEKEREAAAAAAAAANATRQDGAPAPGTKFGMGGTVASKIMARMGYREGQGLGKSEQGMSIALQVEKTSKRGGKIIHERDIAKMQEKEMAAASNTPPPAQSQSKQEISNASLLRNPSKVIVLRNMVGPGEVDDELEGETADECSKYGKVIKCLIFEIRDVPDDEAVRIFLEFERLESAIKAVVDLNGRYFGGRIVKGNFYSLDKFHQFELAEPVE